MSKDSISKTAQVNLQMLARLGVPEAVTFRDELQLEGDPLSAFAHVPFARSIPLCVSCISEVLYQSANQLILEADNPTILDLACGYSPRVLLMAPKGYTYIGADLPDVAQDLMEHRSELIPANGEWFAGYRMTDVTNQEQMEHVLAALREQITIVTQGLLSYLDRDQKHELAENVRSLLARDGGCWIIPDADPGTMLVDTFGAVLGNTAAAMVSQIYKIVDAAVGRDTSKVSWRSGKEMTAALQGLGFSVRRVPLYRDGMELRCLGQVGDKAAARLVSTWQEKSSLVVSLPSDC